MPARPRISIVLPVYNGSRYLDEAIDSLRAQSFPHFELLVLDDGSTDASASLAERHQSRDPRVKLHRFPHRGLVTTLNQGVELARGEYIARADADDRSLPNRFAAQIAYMDRHPEMGICGTSMRVIDGYEWHVAEDFDEIRCQLLFGVPMPHGSAMFRRDWLLASGLRYDADFTHAEDFDLLERASRLTKLGNVPEILYEYRRHADQVSSVHAGPQATHSRSIRLRQLARLGASPTDSEVILHQQLGDHELTEPVEAAAAWLHRMIAANQEQQLYDPDTLRRVAACQLYSACVNSPALRPTTVLAFRTSGLHEHVCKSNQRALRLLGRACLPERAAQILSQGARRLYHTRREGTPQGTRAVRHLWHYGELDAREFYILHDRQLVYLVTSKVACTSIKLAIASAYELEVGTDEAIHDPALWQHHIPSFEHAIGRLPNACRHYFKFAFVRDPLERLVSCYVDKVATTSRHFAFPGYPLPAGISFDRFAATVARIPDALADRHFRSQSSTLYDGERLLVDLVGRFETLQEDWRKVATAHDLPHPLPHTNAAPAPRGSDRPHYSPAIRQAVGRRYRKDFLLLGYDDSSSIESDN